MLFDVANLPRPLKKGYRVRTTALNCLPFIAAKVLGTTELLAVKILWELLSLRVVLLGKSMIHIWQWLRREHGCNWAIRTP